MSRDESFEADAGPNAEPQRKSRLRRVIALLRNRPDSEHATTTVEDTGRARYNTRKLQHLSGRREIDRLLRFLLAEGAQIERAGFEFQRGVAFLAGAGDGAAQWSEVE